MNVSSVLAHVQAAHPREVVDTVADGMLLDSSLEEVAKVAVSNEVPASFRFAAARRFLREADVGDDCWQQRILCAERLIDDAIQGADDKDDGALPSCQSLLAKSRLGRDLVRQALLQRLQRGALSEHERRSTIKVVSRLLRSEGGEAMAPVGIELALSCVELSSDSLQSFEAVARWLMPAICAAGVVGDCAASICAIRHAYLLISADEAEHPHRRRLALGALVAGRSVLLASSKDDWEEPVIRAVRLALVADVQCKTSRRYALRLLELAQHGDADWQLWLSAYAIAEFETSVHLFTPALNALDRFLLSYHAAVPLEWILALASRLQTNENPSVRKKTISQLLKCSPSLFTWKFVRDSLLPALDDAEIRKGRDFARQIDASAETFYTAYVAAVRQETFLEICRFICSRTFICARGRIGAVGRDIFLAAVRSCISSKEYEASHLQDINLTDSEITVASGGIVDMMQSANRTTTQKVIEAVAAVACMSSGIAHDPAAVFANVARHVDLIPSWLASLGGPSEWARYCSLPTSRFDAAGAVVAALATDSVCESWQAVARAYVEAKGPAAYVLFSVSKCENKQTRSRLWRALHIDDVRTLDSMTLDQLHSEEYGSAVELRKHLGTLTVENLDHPVSLAWQDISLDLMKATRALLESGEDLTAESYLRSLRCLQTCIIATAPLLETGWRRSLYKLAADISARTAQSSTRWPAIEHERWMFMALLIESAPDIEFDVDMVEVIGALERCNTRVEDVVALLRCVFAVLIRHSKCDQKSDEPLSILVASAEAAARDTNRFGSPKIVRALTQFVFAPACAITLAYPFPKLTKAILRLANGLFQLADARRPHITRALSTSFTVMFQMNAARCNPMEGNLSAFVPILIRLLLDREPELRKCDMPDTDHEEPGNAVLSDNTEVPISRARLCALMFLEDEAICPSRLKRAACLELLKMDAIFRRTNKVAAARKGSEQWGRRLRAWQAICVLAPHLEKADSEVRDLVMLSFPAALVSPCLPCIRYAVETACVSFACRWPSQALPLIFNRLDHVRDAADGTEAGVGGRELALASLLVVAGHVIVEHNDSTASEAAYFNKDGKTVLEARKFAPRLLRAALALQGSTRGLVRGIAQLLIFALCPKDQIPKDLVPDDAAFIASTIAALKRDPDVVRHVSRQRRFFWELRSPQLCTVHGILETGTANDGDVSAESIVTDFKKCIAETAREIELEDYVHGFGQNLWRPGVPRSTHQYKNNLMDYPGKTKCADKTQIFVQRKIDQLLDEETCEIEWRGEASKTNSRGAISSVVTATGYERMRVIVCATLVEKAPNLAGLTRTAEVFAAEAVVVPDIRVLKAIAFQAVSVTAENWIPVEECQPRHLISWLHTKRQEGYAIVALEQATGSVPLTNAVLPTPAVLLLGHEKEGLETDLLHSVDMCVEVPQLGVVRSLNVHVSGLIQLRFAITDPIRRSRSLAMEAPVPPELR